MVGTQLIQFTQVNDLMVVSTCYSSYLLCTLYLSLYRSKCKNIYGIYNECQLFISWGGQYYYSCFTGTIIPVLFLISKQRIGEFKNIACISTVSECQSQTWDTEVWLQSSTV